LFPDHAIATHLKKALAGLLLMVGLDATTGRVGGIAVTAPAAAAFVVVAAAAVEVDVMVVVAVDIKVVPALIAHGKDKLNVAPTLDNSVHIPRGSAGQMSGKSEQTRKS
jgi:hypothetical protein